MNPMMRTKTPMQDEIIPPIYDGQPERNDFAKTQKGNMKDEQWVDSIKLSPIPYRDLDDEALEKVIKDVRREYERRQRERYDMAVKRQSDLELRKKLQGE